MTPSPPPRTSSACAADPGPAGGEGRARPAARLLRRPVLVRVAAVAVLLAALCAASARADPAGPRFDGSRFHQPEPLVTGFTDWLRRTFADSRRGPWRAFTDTPPGPAPSPRVGDGRLRVTFVNHATVLIQMDRLNILTDPMWSDRSAPLIGSRRRRPPGLRFENLPAIDAVLVSHDHYDHMDLPTLRRLAQSHHPRVYAGLRSAAFLAGEGVPGATDLDWWQSDEIAPGVTVTAVSARHMSGRGLFDQDARLWCGFVVRGPSGAVYFAGDTGWGAHFTAIGRRFPGLRLAILPIGGFTPIWYMREQHIGPTDAIAAHRQLGAFTSMPMHFGTFPNGNDAETQPVSTLRAALEGEPEVAGRFIILDNGESAEIPSVPARSTP